MNIDITGARILFRIPIFGGIPITSTITNTWLVMLIITFLCIWMTRGMKTRAETKRQHVAELIVRTVNSWVEGNMGEKYLTFFAPFIAALFAMSAFSSLLSLFGFYPPTADLSATLGWAVMVFVMITYTKIRAQKITGYLKGFTEPIPFLLPLNVVGELSTPISMAFRHFGNIASGQVIGALMYGGLALVSSLAVRWIPGAIGSVLSKIPFAQVGVPAVLSVYFDLFSSFMQAFIFCMLTMNYIASAAETD